MSTEQPTLQPSFESNEVRKFVYTDRSKNPPEIVFEWIGSSILEADQHYQEATGQDPRKQSQVGCGMEKLPDQG